MMMMFFVFGVGDQMDVRMLLRAYVIMHLAGFEPSILYERTKFLVNEVRHE